MRKLFKTLIPAFFLVTCMILLPAGGHAETFPEVMFILDASGSMWGPCDGQTKIEAARSVFEQVVPSLPSEVKLGLTAYGHNRKGDCNDVEILVPAGSESREALLDRIMKVNPKGMTPMATSIKMVADTLKTKEGETTIVLVSDGKETCDKDPCGVVRSLKNSGIKFILHVVGFGVKPEEKEQLTCMAEAGDGQYFGAENADGLLAALEVVKKEVAVKVEKAKATKKKATSKLGKLTIKLPKAGTVSMHAFKVIRTKDGKVIKTIEGPSEDSTHPLLAGDYEIVAAFVNPNYQDPTEVSFGTVTVTGGETATLELGVMTFNIADALKEIPVDAVNIYRKEATDPLLTLLHHGNGYYLFKPKPLPKGVYSLSFTYSRSPGPTFIAYDIAIEAGQESAVTIDSGIGLQKPTGKDVNVQGWNLVPTGKETPALQVRRRWDNDYPLWKVFAVPPGTYDLSVLLKGMEEPLPVGEGLSISKGDLLMFDSGL
ncbi:MAG: VWA domain-containing protein [Deltaproteobacteria bacterium]|nr:VWA domain-containing protein [Deltaproteobacteria bacterium]